MFNTALDYIAHYDIRVMVSFVFVGITSLGWYLIALALLLNNTDVSLGSAAIIAYLASMVWNYTLQRTVTFRSTRHHGETIPLYLLSHGVGMVLNAALLVVLTERIALPMWLAQGLALVAITITSYGLQKWVVFRRS
jgi:putative flippase GtrA